MLQRLAGGRVPQPHAAVSVFLEMPADAESAAGGENSLAVGEEGGAIHPGPMLGEDADFIGGSARGQLFLDKRAGVQGVGVFGIDGEHGRDGAMGGFPLVRLDLHGQRVLEPIELGQLF